MTIGDFLIYTHAFYTTNLRAAVQRYGNLTVFKMAAVRHLGFWKFNFLTVWTIKRPILHNLAKFREDRSICCCDIAIVVIFKKFEILTVVVPGLGLGFIVMPNVIKLGETVAEI